MRVLLSIGALCLMAAGFSLMLDPVQHVDAAVQQIMPLPAPSTTSTAPPSSVGLRIELVGPERFEMGDQISSRPWVALEAGAANDCGSGWPTTTVADATGLLGGV